MASLLMCQPMAMASLLHARYARGRVSSAILCTIRRRRSISINTSISISTSTSTSISRGFSSTASSSAHTIPTTRPSYREWYSNSNSSSNNNTSHDVQPTQTAEQGHGQVRGHRKVQGGHGHNQELTNYKTQQETVTEFTRSLLNTPAGLQETEALLLRLKQDIDRNYPITLSRLELLITHPLFAPHQVLQVCEIARDAGISSGTLYALALDALSRAPHWAQSRRFMDKIRSLMETDGIAPNVRSYLATIRELSKGGKVDKAQALLQAMGQTGISASVATFNALLTQRSKLGHLDQCIDLYRLMKAQGITPNTNTLIILMEGFCAFGGLHYAIQMFEKFKEEGYTINTDLCNVLLKHIAELGTLTQLEFLFKQMNKGESIRPNLETYSFMIAAYKKANLNNKVAEIEALMAQDDYLPDLAEIGAKLINLGKSGYYTPVEKMVNTLQRMGAPLTVECYNALIYAYADVASYTKRTKALAVYKQLQQAKEQGTSANMDTYVALMTIYFKTRDWPNVILTYNDMREYIQVLQSKESEKKENTNIPAPVYSMVISAFLEMGQHAKARELITYLEASNTPVDKSVYETFITALGFAGARDKEEATESDTVEEVMKMVAHMKQRGMEPSITAYKQVLNNLINQNKRDKAVVLLMSLCDTKEGMEMDVDLFAPLIQAFCSNEEPEKALNVINQMKRVGVLPNEYVVTAIIFSLVRAKQYSTAWDIVSWANSTGLDIVGFGDVIQSAQKKEYS